MGPLSAFLHSSHDALTGPPSPAQGPARVPIYGMVQLLPLLRSARPRPGRSAAVPVLRTSAVRPLPAQAPADTRAAVALARAVIALLTRYTWIMLPPFVELAGHPPQPPPAILRAGGHF